MSNLWKLGARGVDDTLLANAFIEWEEFTFPSPWPSVPIVPWYSLPGPTHLAFPRPSLYTVIFSGHRAGGSEVVSRFEIFREATLVTASSNLPTTGGHGLCHAVMEITDPGTQRLRVRIQSSTGGSTHQLDQLHLSIFRTYPPV